MPTNIDGQRHAGVGSRQGQGTTGARVDGVVRRDLDHFEIPPQRTGLRRRFNLDRDREVAERHALVGVENQRVDAAARGVIVNQRDLPRPVQRDERVLDLRGSNRDSEETQLDGERHGVVGARASRQDMDDPRRRINSPRNGHPGYRDNRN